MILFLAFTIVSGKLSGVYDEGNENKVFVVPKSLTLICNAPDTSKIIWMKNNVNVNEVKSLSGRFDAKKGNFTISKTINDDAGNYSCNLDDESQNFQVWSQVIVRIPQNIYVVENDKLEILCDVRAGTDPVLTWFYSNTSESSDEIQIFSDDERIILENHGSVELSKLTIEKVELSDRGTYYCRGTNRIMEELKISPDEAAGLVRIKGKLAALWPFLGICAEVFVLCAIILIYEKRRNKTDLDESDTDQSPDQKNDHHIKDMEVRHRK